LASNPVRRIIIEHLIRALLSNDRTQALSIGLKTKLDRSGIFHQYLVGTTSQDHIIYTHGMDVTIIGNT